MLVKIKGYGKLPVKDTVNSIFDAKIAGQFADDGKYYCVHVNYKTGGYYALTKDSENEVMKQGRTLMENETATFLGTNVRGMTFEEERAYNEEQLGMLVDLWCNVEAGR